GRGPCGPRELVGVIAGIAAPAPAPEGGLRPVQALLAETPLLRGELLESLHWLGRYTRAPLGEVLATALPAALRRGEPLPDTHAWAWRLTEAGATALPGLRAGSRPRRLAELLHGTLRDEEALGALMDGWRPAARALQGRGLAERIAVPASQVAPTPAPGP